MTAAGDDPGTPSVTKGIIAAGAAALLAISDAVTPRKSPLPNWLLSLAHRMASLYETNAAIGLPAPGRIPMKLPIAEERSTCHGCESTFFIVLRVSPPLGLYSAINSF